MGWYSFPAQKDILRHDSLCVFVCHILEGVQSGLASILYQPRRAPISLAVVYLWNVLVHFLLLYKLQREVCAWIQ